MAETLRIYSLCIPFYCIIPLGSNMLQAMALPNWSLGMALVRNLVFIEMYAAAAMVSLYWIYWAVVFGFMVGGAMVYLFARGIGKDGRDANGPALLKVCGFNRLSVSSL